MSQIISILGNPVWGGIGVIVTLIIGLIGYYLTNRNPMWLYVAFSISFFCLGFLVSALLIKPNPPLQYDYTVSASTYPLANTKISINDGDEMHIIVQGNGANWNCGTGSTSPEGDPTKTFAAFTNPNANLCELIGSIEPNKYFRVGYYSRFTATASGTLQLGANDEARIDKYIDNIGTLNVHIIVISKKS